MRTCWRLACAVCAVASCTFERPPDVAANDANCGRESCADPSMLSVQAVSPSLVYEGQGARDDQGQPLGSRPAVLVLSGVNFFKEGTTVTVQAAAEEAVHPMIVVDNDAIVVNADHTRLAVPVHIDVDPSIGSARETIALDILVKQTADVEVESPLVGALMLQALPELTETPAGGLTGADTARMFSSISITTGAFVVAANQTSPIRIRSMSSANIAIPINVSALGSIPGPAGGMGGVGGTSSMAGGPGGPDGLGGAGGAAGYPGRPGTDGTFAGSMYLPTLAGIANPNRSRGGGGGGAADTNTADGGNGGGGGGAIHLRADGDMSIASDISAEGATGGASGPPSTLVYAGGRGGDGTGGVVLLQAGSRLTVDGAVSVAGGGDAPAGAVRFDAADTSFAPGYRGPAFVDVPLIATTPRPTISVIGKASSDFNYYISTASGASDLQPRQFDSDGKPSIVSQFALAEYLEPGINHLCLLVPGADKGSETETCVDIAYLTAP
jgi:hypothetical protein